MGRKRNPYIQLFTRDILSSPRCRALSESAAGVYLFLLCRLNEPPTPGAYRISDWELHPNWKRSCTQQCLATADKQARLQYFAKMLSKNDLPWKTATILVGLQELYKYGIITVEGDMLVQPRMFKDNGFELPDIDNDGDPVGTILDDPTSGSMALRGDDDFTENKGGEKGAENGTEKGTEKVQRKAPVSHAGASHAEIEIENNINNNGTNNNIDSSAKKNAKFVPPTLEQVQQYCQEKAFTFDPVMFWNHYEANGWVQGKGKPIKSWKACCVTWQQREGEFITPAPKTPSAGAKIRPGASSQPRAGDPVAATPAAKGKYKNKW